MGGSSRWTPTAWDDYASTTQGRSTQQIFSSTAMDDYLDPKTHKPRESCDSAINPNSTPIIVALDNTGSMGHLAAVLAREGLNTLIQQIYDRKPVSDPHVMIMSVGDAYSDRSPLQVTQFECDISLAKQLEKIYLEGNGGGNNGESYNLAWYYAAYHTEIDSLKKRGRKGILFTVGDEPMHPQLLAQHVRDVIGGELKQDISTKDLLTTLKQKYDVYHVIIKEGGYAQSDLSTVQKSWYDLLGKERVLELSDYNKLSEAIVSAIQVNEGSLVHDVAKSWDGSTSLVVADAIKNLAVTKGPQRGSGIVRVAGAPQSRYA